MFLVFLALAYVTVASVFPARDEIGWGERVALSLVLSIVIVPLLGLFLNLIGADIGFGVVVFAITAYVLSIGVLAYLRRMRMTVDRRLSASIEFALPFGG